MSQQIEQLWAIQSTDFGVKPVICAASSNLLDNKFMLQKLQKYLLYTLPPEWDLKEDRQKAPISLSLRKIEGSEQRILVHKVYIDQATVTQAGTYFIHVLADLPDTFSARDAMRLWRSDLWEIVIKEYLKNRSSLNTNNVAKLNTLSLNTLTSAKKTKFPGIDQGKIDRHLSYVIQAHLLQQQMQMQSQEIRPLYITAETDEVAYLISSLLAVIPPQLQKHVTFSTYEGEESPDPPCWLLGTYMPADDGMCINYSNGNISALPDKSLLPMRYSMYAARCWRNSKNGLENLYTFLDPLKSMSGLTLSSFLSEYYSFYNSSNRTKDRLAQFLKKSTPDLLYALEDEDIRADLIDCALIDRGEFLVTLTQRLSEIRYESQGGSKKGLTRLMKDTCDALIQAAETNNVDFFLAALVLLDSLSPTLNTWIDLLNKLTLETRIIYSYWEVRVRLLEIVDKVFIKKDQEDWKILSSLLDGISIEEFPRLLMLNIAPEWIFKATRHGIEGSILGVLERRRLEQLLKEHGGYLVRNTDDVQVALILFACAIYNRCMDKLPIVFSWLDQPADQPVDRDTLDGIYMLADLSSEECRVFIEHYSPGYKLPRPAYIFIYPEALIWQAILRVFARERKKEKIDLLFLCLDGLKVHKNLPVDQLIEHLFEAAALSEREEIVRFFEGYEHDPALYRASPSVRDLARAYMQYGNIASLPLPRATQIKQIISMVLPEAQQQTSEQVTINSFLHSPASDIDTIRKLATAISGLSADGRMQLVKPVTKNLIACIDDVFQLSSAIAILDVYGRDYCIILLEEMAAEVNALFKLNVRTKPDLETLDRERLRLAIYVHYMLVFAILYEYNYDLPLSLLSRLLRDIDAETFQFFNKITTTWPSALREQWRVVEQRLNPFRQPVSVPVLPVSQPTSDANYIQFVPQEQKNVYDDEADRARKDMDVAQSKQGARPLALVWFRHSIIFMQHRHTIDTQKLLKMKVLSEFYMACQQADTFYPPDPAAEQAIIAIVDNTANKDYLSNLTKKEKKRIELARRQSKQTMQPPPVQSQQTSMHVSSGTQLPLQGSQNQGVQWTQSQPQKKR